MDELLLFRLDLLVNAKEIDEAVRDAVIELVQAVEKRYSLTITEDNGAMLVSHLAMALGRIKRGEELEPIDEDIFAEVKQTQTYRELHELYLPLEKRLQITLHQTEKDFLALHLCALVEDVE